MKARGNIIYYFLLKDLFHIILNRFSGTLHQFNSVRYQAILNKFIKKKLEPVCKWEWSGNRCTIRSPGDDTLELCLELQDAARLIYENRDYLRNIKKHVSPLLTTKHKGMNKRDLLSAFESFFDASTRVEVPKVRKKVRIIK